jgi:dCTP deaminase
MNQIVPDLFPTQPAPDPAVKEHRRTTGLLPSQDIRQLIAGGRIHAAHKIAEEQLQPASLDLRLGPVAYRVRASFLPGENCRVAGKIDGVLMHEIDLSRPTVLERGCVYIIPLMEELSLPAGISGQANPKSTTGRLDIFVRLIVDGADEFERVPPGYRGPLYAEVVPRTFSVVVTAGTKLNQIRFRRGTPPPSDKDLGRLHSRETLVYHADDRPADAKIDEGLWLSIDLEGRTGAEVVGYRARTHAPLIDLAKVGAYDPRDFWEEISPPRHRSLILNPDDFYILASRERVRVPPTYAAEMVAYDPSVGEFRIHYAGFFDPGFGYGNAEIKGTHAVLEVRSHEVPFLLEDGQVVGRLVYEPLLEVPDRLYGLHIGSSYQNQGLALSKQFRRHA